jgi:hypothetical protein
MVKFGSVRLVLGKDVKKGDQESLQSLFHSLERFRPIVVKASAAEDAAVRVVLQGLGSTELKLGDDMKRGQVKTIMTLFWFAERSRPIDMKHRARAGKAVNLTITLVPVKTAVAG